MQKETLSYKIVLWLDDTRLPTDELIERYRQVGEDINVIKVIWVRNYNEFINYIILSGLPDQICFDYDLNYQVDPNKTEVEYYNDEISQHSLIWVDNLKNGYDCAKWLIEYCNENRFYIPICTVHSSNVIGKDEIETLFN